MELVCPTCRTRYHLERSQLPRRKMRLRCAACSAQFQVDLRKPMHDTSVHEHEGREQRWAHRLARTLISDILIYNRARRDRALAENRLLDEFSDELAAAWHAFRAEAEGTETTRLFRHAVNTLLGDGRPLL